MTTQIRSYLCDPFGKRFVELTSDNVDELKRNRYFYESGYTYGAIELTVDGVSVFTKTMWDLVDQLWAYIVRMVQELKEVGRAEGGFPDQPLDFFFEAVGNRSLVKVSAWARPPKNRTVVVADTESFVDSLLAEADRVFRLFLILIPELASVYELCLEDIANYYKL